jgi:hypothetical protein
MLLGGKSDTLSVQVWPVGIEDCIAPPVEGEETGSRSGFLEIFRESLWLWPPCPMPFPSHFRDIQQGCITDGLENFYSFFPSSFSSASFFVSFLFLDLDFRCFLSWAYRWSRRLGFDQIGSGILYLICEIWYSLGPDPRSNISRFPLELWKLRSNFPLCPPSTCSARILFFSLPFASSVFSLFLLVLTF